MTNPEAPEFSYKPKNILTTILLLSGLIFPPIGFIGIILMWIRTKWATWIKLLITAIFGLIFLISSAILLTSVGVLTYLFVAKPVQVKGMAMFPNYTDGMYLISKPLFQKNIDIKRFDVIVFKYPKNPNAEFIKRVIGLPGETAMIKEGSVYINQQRLDENEYLPIAFHQTFDGSFLAENQEIAIPSGYYFVLGDNRSFSSDSRDWGLVPQGYITSKIAFCYWNCKSDRYAPQDKAPATPTLPISSTPTIEWKPVNLSGCNTKNTDFSYSLNIPLGWSVSQEENDENRTTYKISQDQNTYISLSCETAGIGGAICLDDNQPGINFSTDFLVNGIKVRGCFWSSGENNQPQALIKMPNPFGFFIFDTQGINKSLLDQILSTFKFPDGDK